MYYVMALAAIMLAIWIAWPSATIPVVAKAVTAENVREHRIDEGTFRARWSVVNDLPPATVYEPLLIGGEGVARRNERQTVGATVSARLLHRSRRVSLRRSNICSRHGMRRVITRGGRSWRCRR